MRLLIFLLLIAASVFSQEVPPVDANTPRDTQIKIAKSAAPKEISDKANIYVLGKNGYELAVKGNNGFTCVVERQFPDTMEPECYDQEGSRTTFLVRSFFES